MSEPQEDSEESVQEWLARKTQEKPDASVYMRAARQHRSVDPNELVADRSIEQAEIAARMVETFRQSLPLNEQVADLVAEEEREAAGVWSPPMIDPLLPKVVIGDAAVTNINPAHYRSDPSGVECITIVRHLSFCKGNALKYIFRLGGKDEAVQELKKARWYLNAELETRSLERWALYPHDVRYEVSSQGRVRRVDSQRLRKPVPIKNGYLTLVFSTPSGHVLRYVHHMVAETFIEPHIRAGLEVAHLDGVRANCALWNLEIKTTSGNYYDRFTAGTEPLGERGPSSKLTQAEVDIIRSSDESPRQLAQRFGVSRSQIQRVRSGENWSGKAGHEFHDGFRALISSRDGNIRRAMEAIYRDDLHTASSCIADEIVRLGGDPDAD